MKPPKFEYHRPADVSDAIELLNERPTDTRVLAGGQSLVPLLNMRLTRPAVLIDVNRLTDLASIELSAGMVKIGAMVRQRSLETDPVIRKHLPVLAEAASHIAHLAIRTRGTLGGSLAHADPAAELPAIMALLDATMVIAGADQQERRVDASNFFLGPFTTSLQPGELLRSVEIPVPPPGSAMAFAEVSRVHGAFALVGAAALVRLDSAGVITEARLSLCGVGDGADRVDWVDDMARDAPLTVSLNDAIGERVSQWVTPLADIHAGVDYRRRVAGRLAARVLNTAAKRSAELSMS